ncbi:MAG: 3-oxoadipate enol-lactonase [Desulfobacteraceae bacterium]|nr:MAG: 3-oxoadipate enol-lactonase [Desulfobacteraceae bacterium]
MKVEANGIEIHYELTGKEELPVVMLSHSLACSMVMWNPQMEVLLPHFRVLRFDTRGHGGSSAPKGTYTLEQLADDALALLDALRIDRVHFVGLSMGGMIGQSLALNHPDRLKSLTLCDTAAVIPHQAQPVWEERIEKARNKGMQALAQQTLERWFTQPYLEQSPPHVELIRSQILSTPVDGYIGCSEAIRRLNYLERLSKIALPTLVIVGEEDPGTPVEAAKAIHSRIRDSKLVILVSAAHLSNIEQAQYFNRALIAFLTGQSAG